MEGKGMKLERKEGGRRQACSEGVGKGARNSLIIHQTCQRGSRG